MANISKDGQYRNPTADAEEYQMVDIEAVCDSIVISFQMAQVQVRRQANDAKEP